MHILFLTDNFPPEGNAPATRTFEHAKVWVAEGHKVTVITCVPNFPEGVVYPGYENSFYQKEEVEGIEVRRVKTYITANEGFVKRTLDYMSFMCSGFIAGLFVKKPDVIVATSPQFFCACSGWALSLARWKPFVFELRDIWPASIKAVGASANSRLLNLLENLEMFLYRRARLIVSVTHSFKEELVQRGIDSEKIAVVLNGVDLSQYKQAEKDVALATQYGLEDKFVVGYVGTHGLAHGLETIVETAEMMVDNKDIVFLFAGGGAKATEIKAKVEEKSLDNVLVLGRQEKSTMPAIWSLCDASIVHLRDEPLFTKVIPSKIFESMAMGLPILIGVPEGEATDIVKNTDSGLVFKPESVEALSKVVQDLYLDEAKQNHFQINCERAARKFDRKQLALNMLRELEELVA